MIILGWTKTVANLPAGVTLHGAGPVYMVCAQARDAKTPRQRIAMQVSCFDAGINFLPAAPSHCLHLPKVAPIDLIQEMAATLSHVDGRGQFTLSFHSQAPQSTTATSGQQWLQLRHAHQQKSRAHEDILLELAAASGCQKSPTRIRGATVSSDFLVPKAQTDAVRALFAEHLHADPRANDASATLTGLWPPFGFTNPIQFNES